MTEADYDPNSHGTCTASKVAGRVIGVAKKASLIVVKQGLTPSSWLDAMVKVNNDLKRRARAGERVAGYNVIRTQTGSPRMDKYSIIKIKYLILKYVEKYGVIFVCTIRQQILPAISMFLHFSPQNFQSFRLDQWIFLGMRRSSHPEDLRSRSVHQGILYNVPRVQVEPDPKEEPEPRSLPQPSPG